MNSYSAFERSGTGLPFWLGDPLSTRAPFFRILVFSGTAATGACMKTAYYVLLLHKILLWHGMGLPFFMGHELPAKLYLKGYA